MSAVLPTDVQVSTRGRVSELERDEASAAIRRVAQAAHRPVLSARVTLVNEPDPARARPAIAKATLDVNGRPVRAHVAAEEMQSAIGFLEHGLRRRLERVGELARAPRRETGESAPGEWRHGDLPAHRPEYYPRPEEERELIRRKTYTLDAMTPEEAAWEMELLDLDFYLFVDAASRDDAVVHRGEDGLLGLRLLEAAGAAEVYDERFRVDAARAPDLSVADALEELSLTGEPFVFFRDRETRRGAVAYRRYDGHYGLVAPSG
jgi:hypothetical protein